MRIVLASNSPRRKKIMEDIGLNFDIILSDYDEKLDDDTFSYEVSENIATQKALDVVHKVGHDEIVIGADTIVVLHNKILGKPKDKQDAFNMLKKLSGETHSVVTTICGINTKTNRAALLSTTSYVRFCHLSDEQINGYIEKYNPLDKAGSYGIQEMPDGYIDKYEGSLENIIGLDSQSVMSVLNQLGYHQ